MFTLPVLTYLAEVLVIEGNLWYARFSWVNHNYCVYGNKYCDCISEESGVGLYTATWLYWFRNKMQSRSPQYFSHQGIIKNFRSTYTIHQEEHSTERCDHYAQGGFLLHFRHASTQPENRSCSTSTQEATPPRFRDFSNFLPFLLHGRIAFPQPFFSSVTLSCVLKVCSESCPLLDLLPRLLHYLRTD